MNDTEYGYVCYIDILGMTHLTRKMEESPEKVNICNNLISKLHEIIAKNIKDTTIGASVLSDSVFLYLPESRKKGDTKILNYLLCIAKIFRESAAKEIFIRAGLAKGMYYKLQTDLNIANIYGPAVSDAVGLERSGKGFRIFISNSIKNEFFDSLYMKHLFGEYMDYKDYVSCICTFHWPLILDGHTLNIDNNNSEIDNVVTMKPDTIPILYKDSRLEQSNKWYKMTGKNKKNFNVDKSEEELIKSNNDILELLMNEEAFIHNKENSEGKAQILASVNYIKSLNY